MCTLREFVHMLNCANDSIRVAHVSRRVGVAEVSADTDRREGELLLLPKMISRCPVGKALAIACGAFRCSAIDWHVDNVAQNENAILS